MALSEDAKLNFLTGYLVQQRQEIMTDKAGLSRFFIAKGALAGALIAAIGAGSVLAVQVIIILGPFFLMIIDMIYRKRLNEIFSRWKHLTDQVLPAIAALGVSEPNKFFEDEIRALEETLLSEERGLKSVVISPVLLAAPTAAGLDALPIYEEVPFAAYGIAVLAMTLSISFAYMFLFGRSSRFVDTYRREPIWISLAFGFAISGGVWVAGLAT